MITEDSVDKEVEKAHEWIKDEYWNGLDNEKVLQIISKSWDIASKVVTEYTPFDHSGIYPSKNAYNSIEVMDKYARVIQGWIVKNYKEQRSNN